MGRIGKITYILKHRKAFKKVEQELLGKGSNMWVLHDLDKIPLTLLLGPKLSSKIHRKNSNHHVESSCDKKDWIQMIIDWECARYTKPDKPLNAFETMVLYYPETEKFTLPLLKGLGIDKAINPMELLEKRAKGVTTKIRKLKRSTG